MNCANCINRWYGVIAGKAQWFCRKNLKHKRAELPVIGNDADLRKSKGCREYKL